MLTCEKKNERHGSGNFAVCGSWLAGKGDAHANGTTIKLLLVHARDGSLGLGRVGESLPNSGGIQC